eukprot:scaffold50716_cov63-Phaeocystis_antarctica.AAC.4
MAVTQLPSRSERRSSTFIAIVVIVSIASGAAAAGRGRWSGAAAPRQRRSGCWLRWPCRRAHPAAAVGGWCARCSLPPTPAAP